jgi:hypothetical protein
MTQLSPSIARVAGRIERVAPGGQAESALVEIIRGLQATDRLAPVWVVVPSRIVGLSLRRRLVEESAFAGVGFTPIGALSQVLGGTDLAIAGRQPLSPVALRAAARVALAEAPGVLDQVAHHATTAAGLASTYRDLRRLSEQDLDRLASASNRAHDIVRLTRRMRTLVETTYYDSTDVLEAAIARLDAGDAASGPDLAEIGAVVVYLPDPLPPL